MKLQPKTLKAARKKRTPGISPAAVVVESAGPGPDIVVVIPTYRQPMFLVEAIASVLEQNTALRIVTVVVDDGCPLPSTRDTARVFAAREPDRVFYIRRPNGGLSAARNSGIEFALSAFPALKAIYFLDSDNRILPGFLDRAFGLLRDHHAGWAYPDFDMFGVPGFYSAKGKYSALLHLAYNYCEAGSLVARAVFDQGARFDETMKLGFEDWDFWWQAIERGFRGVFVPCAGFQYRRRGESMLTHSERRRTEILAVMRRKHRALHQVRRLVELEAAELPRFRLALVDRDEVHPLFDPARWVVPESSDLHSTAAFVDQFCLAEYAPAAFQAPRVIAVARAATLAILTRWKLARYLFWWAEARMKSAYFLAVKITVGVGPELRLGPERDASPGDLAAVDLFFCSAYIVEQILHDSSSLWVDSLSLPSPMPKVVLIEIALPEAAQSLYQDEDYATVRRLLDLMAAIRARLALRPGLPMDWRDDRRMARQGASQQLFSDLGLGTVLPHLAPADKKQVGFLLPIFEFGGVEKVVVNYAMVLTELGYSCHLFMTERRSVIFSDLCDAAFETINFIAEDAQCVFDWTATTLPNSDLSSAARDTLGLLATMDIVFNTHCPRLHGLIGELRRLGAKTYVGLHLNEIQPSGMLRGNANFALDFEHVYDGFVVISDELRSWCLGQSVPAEKIHLIRNAPSYPVSEQILADTRELRAGRAREQGALRVLFLGRLDPQKGIDRLEQIYRATVSDQILWRIIGKPVVESDELAALPLGFPIEPPALGFDELTALYQWADVVVLPSRFEGVPLTLLEAQRLGSVVIATDVGAVAEIVDDRRDGFLIRGTAPEPVVIENFVALILELARDRGLLASIFPCAMDRAGALDWRDTMAPWTLSFAPEEIPAS